MEEQQKQGRIQFYWEVLKNTVTLYRKHETGTLGAALSYYMVFSIAPVIIIVLTLVGTLLGPQAVHGELHDQLKDFLGGRGAHQVEKIITKVYDPDKTGLASVVAGIVLIIGSTSVFRQLRKSLNTIWEVKPQARKAWITYFLNHAFSFGVIICIAFLLLVSFVINAAVEALSGLLANIFSDMAVWIVQAFNHALTLASATTLFAFVYKYLSDAKLKWGDVWEGAFFTAILFSLGKYLISFYIGVTHIASTYGAIGGAVMILVWVFYSSQIVFFGAQFTRALATQRGFSLDPATMRPDVQGTKLKEAAEIKNAEAATSS